MFDSLGPSLVALVTLIALEIALGIDNVIFIAILADKLPEEQQERARRIGIGLAVISRLVLLSLLYFLVNDDRLTRTVLPFDLSIRDLILILGGAFLIGKSTYEIHEKLEGYGEHASTIRPVSSMRSVLIQIMLIDLVFSLDSVLTAVGIAEQISVMIIAIVVAAAVMLLGANAISSFIERHPTFKILALSFLILIGAILVIEGVNEELAEELHIKNYAYFAIAFSVIIESINIRLRRKEPRPVPIHRPQLPQKSSGD